MEQNLNNSQNDFLWTLLANPADDARIYAYNLQRLVNDFPQSGILQALFAHASEEKNLKRASVYFNPRSLFKLINAPSTFPEIPPQNIFTNSAVHLSGGYQHNRAVFNEKLAAAPEEITDSTGPEIPAVEVALLADSAVAIDHGHEPVIENSPEADLNTTVAEEHRFIEQDLMADKSDVIEAGEENITTEIDGPVDQDIEMAPAPEPEVDIEKYDEKDTDVTPQEVWEPVNESSGDVATVNEVPAEPVIATIQEAPQHDLETTIDVAEAKENGPPETFIEKPETPQPFAEINEAAIIETPETEINGHEIYAPYSEIEEQGNAIEDGLIETVIPEAEAQELLPTTVEETAFVDDKSVVDEVETGIADASIALPEEINSNYNELENVAVAEMPAIEQPTVEPAFTENEDIDETFEEIVGIEDINFNNTSTGKRAADDNFFSFHQEFSEDAGEGAKEIEHPLGAGVKAEVNDQQDLSKYNDEKMPYTFMWWLDKTRKEHAAAYQPYVKPNIVQQPAKKQKEAADELQQQYYENIFHLTSVDELDKNPAPPKVPYNIKPKEQVIIERFIKEEPQIKPQSSDKLDNENKAKKSSEDRDELVTETLAAIYSDQMLYHKAIASYKRLILRYPEKTRYFAEKIEQLEKKVN